jgi:hypothetical protein
MAYSQSTLSKSEILAVVENSFRNFALRDIILLKDFKPPVPLAVFILCSCFIDQVSGFRYNRDSPKSRFIEFVNEYMPAYDSKSLVEDLRNKLVHNYSVGAEKYVLTGELEVFHLKSIIPGSPITLSLPIFIKDLQDAFESYISDLKSNPQVKDNCISWYNENRIFTLQQYDLRKLF